MGVNARLIDAFIFGLGAGVAGIGGVVLAMLGPVTPNVGQSYIVTAFLVVVLGGLGSMIGTTIAAVMIGLFMALSQKIGRASCRERVSVRVDLGGRRIIKKKNSNILNDLRYYITHNMYIVLLYN